MKLGTFKVGDIVISLCNITFTDGSKHIMNMEYEITVDTVSYFNVNHSKYRLK